MALRQRNFFFDPLNTDRFSSQDIPTEQTMTDWCDSVPFIKETTDRSQLSRAGISKSSTDARVNSGDNTDNAGISPLGFTTFVRPAQIPKILNSPSVTWAKVPRGGATNTDTGVGIEDWQATVNFPVNPVETTATVELHDNYTTNVLTGTFPCSVTELPVTTPQGQLLNIQLQVLNNAIDQANYMIMQLCDALCDSQSSQVRVGDIVLSVTDPAGWGDKWEEPTGQELTIADHPDLYAIFGNTYGAPSDPTKFKLPDLVSQQNYLKVKSTSGTLQQSFLSGGQSIRTLSENDLPIHSHTVSGTALGGDHQHTFPIYDSASGNGVVDGNPGSQSSVNYTTPLNGAHTHPVTGTTDSFGQNPPNPIWNISTSVTPRYTNTYLKMRVKK